MSTKVKIAPPYIPPNMEMGVLMHSTFPAVRTVAESQGLSFTYYKYLCDWEYGTLIIRVHGAAEYSVKANFDIDGENYRVETDISLIHPVNEGERPRYTHLARIHSGERANSPDTLAARIGVQFSDAIRHIAAQQ